MKFDSSSPLLNDHNKIYICMNTHAHAVKIWKWFFCFSAWIWTYASGYWCALLNLNVMKLERITTERWKQKKIESVWTEWWWFWKETRKHFIIMELSNRWSWLYLYLSLFSFGREWNSYIHNVKYDAKSICRFKNIKNDTSAICLVFVYAWVTLFVITNNLHTIESFEY